MAGTRRLQGSVKPGDGEAGRRRPEVFVTRRGAVIAEAPVGRDGTFDLDIPAGKGLAVTIIGQGGRVLRRPLGATRGSRVDLGDVELPFLEFPPGIDGQAWDERSDRPVMNGVAELRLRKELVASRELESNGTFSFELTRKRLLTPGAYHVVIEAPGYRRARRAVAVTDDVTSYRLGRIELTSAKNA